MTKAQVPGSPLLMDTGWAWLVAGGACFCLFFTCGFSYSTGVYYVVFLETFGASKGQTAWISSLNFGVLCAVGPISSLLIKGISCRFSVFIGGIISSTGLLLSAFAGNIYVLKLTFGILTGAGFGLVFTACVVILSEYFIKYRVVAMGLAMSGTGLGTIAYPWVSRLLLDIYGWRGALIMSAGINAHVCIAALLMRPNKQQKKLNVSKNQIQPIIQLQISRQNSSTNLTSDTSRRHSINIVTTPVSNNEDSLFMSTAAQHSKQVLLRRYSMGNNRNNNNNIFSTLRKSSIRSVCSGTGRPPMLSIIWRIIHYFDLNIFTKPTFLLISANTFLFCFGISVIYTHISAYAASVGLAVLDRDALISAIGLTNLIGRVVLGLAAQCLPINATWLFIVSYLLAGLGIAGCALITSFTGLLFCVCTFGFFSAGFGPLLAEVTCLAVGVMKFSMAYGHLMVFMAIGTMIGAPIAGVLYDHTHHYQASFYLGGACLILSAAIMLLDVLPSRCQRQNYKSDEVQTVLEDEGKNV